jgi:hypothetical protein
MRTIIAISLLFLSSIASAYDLVIIIPEDQKTRVLQGYTEAFGYQEYLSRGGTKTRAQYAKEMVARHIKETLKNYEATQDGIAAQKTRKEEIESTITIE